MYSNTGIHRTVLFLSLIVIPAVAAGAQSAETAHAVKPDLFRAHPWLDNRVSLVQEFDLAQRTPAMSSRGVYGVGNGRAFALVGAGIPQNRLTNIVGPVYEKSESIQLPPVWNRLVVNNMEVTKTPVEDVQLTESLLYRVRGAAITVNRESNGELAMYSVTYAPPDEAAIFRIITVRNKTDRPLEGLSLVVESHDRDEKAGVFMNNRLLYEAADRRMLIDIPGASVKALPGRLELPLGVLAPGGEATAVLRILFFGESVGPEEIESAPESMYPRLEATRRHWNEWLGGALSVRSSDGRLGDLIENTLLLLGTQIVDSNGALAVMARYSGTWCRDSYGPVRFLLWGGKYDAARRIAAYYDYATRMTGFRNRYNADLDIDSAPAGFNWNDIRPQKGDDPNILILHIYNVFRFTGDTDFVREHYGFMRRNMLGQEYENFIMPFHGDETYQVYVMMAESAAMDRFYSVDTGFWYAVAAEAMSEMADAAGEKEDAALFAKLARRCRAVVDETYWLDDRGFYSPYMRKESGALAGYPFANINLRPLWNGYGDADDIKMKSNLLKTVRALMSKNGTMDTTPRLNYYTGMTPGLLLFNLKKMGVYKLADRAFHGMTGRIMSPTGEFAEAYDGKDHWLEYASNPNIYRPWETAINIEALLYYMLGMEYDHHRNSLALYPHLPPGTDWIEYDNFHAGPATVDIDIRRNDSGMIEASVVNSGEGAVSVEVYMEAGPGMDTPPGASAEDTHPWGRRLWLYEKQLAPGEALGAISGAVYR